MPQPATNCHFDPRRGASIRLSVKRFIAHFLFVLAAWTITIKFILPVIWALVYQQALTSFIYWDFWWVVHIWLGWALLKSPPYLLWLAWITSIAEIVIICSKFTLFLIEPHWTVWSMNWFVNKVFVLACFFLLVGHLITPYIRKNTSEEKG